MKVPNMTKVVRGFKTAFVKHDTEIIMGLGISGMITTTIMAVKATPKAIHILNEEECRRSKLIPPPYDQVDWKDRVKLCWRCYIPSAAVGTLSVACLVSATSINAKRNAALATAYSISESVLKDYQEKVIETIGEKKEELIRGEIAKDKITQNPPNEQSIIITNKGDTLCYDAFSGRYFRGDADKFKRVENELNRVMLDEQYVSLNDFYYEIGLENIPLGDELGWTIDDGRDGRIDLYFTSQLTPEGVPCLVINYRVQPRKGYYKQG